jgi:hypothetical protein
MWDQTGESRVYAPLRIAAEEQQRFDKTWMLSFTPPETTPASANFLPASSNRTTIVRRTRFASTLKDANIIWFDWHDLRHTFVIRLHQKSFKQEDIAEALGVVVSQVKVQ